MAVKQDDPPRPVDQEQLDELLGRFVTDLGATISAGSVILGDRLGLYRALAGAGPLTPAELAAYTGTAERYVREWLAGQAAGRYVSHDATTGRYSMTPEQALAFAAPDGLALPGAFELAAACLADGAAIEDAFRSGQGVARGDHHPGVHTGCERFYRPGHVQNLVSSWIPAVGGLVDRLTAVIAVADVGCGLGTSTRILADTFPASTVTGFDPHETSIDLARAAAREAEKTDLCGFTVARAQNFPGTDYGLVATFDCLHDMGDPVSAARANARGQPPRRARSPGDGCVIGDWRAVRHRPARGGRCGRPHRPARRPATPPAAELGPRAERSYPVTSATRRYARRPSTWRPAGSAVGGRDRRHGRQPPRCRRPVPAEPTAAYNASKGALVNLTRHLAAQWGPRGVRANALARIPLIGATVLQQLPIA